MKPPRSVQLPTGRVVELVVRRAPGEPRKRKPEAPLFAEALDLFASGDVVIRAEGVDVDVTTLALADFHALRAIATRLGWLDEAPGEIECRNCHAAVRHAPCAALELGPFADRELVDPELDRLLELTVDHPIGRVRIMRRVAKTIRFEAVDVARAKPLFAALAKRELVVTADVVRAMGIVALGDVRDPAKIAVALRAVDDDAWNEITTLFLDAHYPLRLASIAMCPACGARNDVDAPDEREFDRLPERRSPPAESSNAAPFPPIEQFDEKAQKLFYRIRKRAARAVVLVVDEGEAACDDGGEPLLGSYEPPSVGSPEAPSRQAEVTVYYRTFRAIWDEEGEYDWEAELKETISHELEHHDGWLAGDDPMDDEERAEIAGEATRIIGRQELARRQARWFGGDVASFLKRTWPLWLLVAVATAIATLADR